MTLQQTPRPRKDVSGNIKRAIHFGKPLKQAVGLAFRLARKRKKGRSKQ